jgi:hypothetical protein
MEGKRLLRHVVMFKFKETATEETVREIEKKFAALPGKIDVIAGFEWGTDVSVENKQQGFTHCFFVSFESEKDRDAYIPHPAHQAFSGFAREYVDKVLVLDYWAD